MVTFSEFHEAFSLNPRHWFMSKEQRAKIEAEDREFRNAARQKATYAFKELKDLLQQKGYSLQRHKFAYHQRKDRKLALSRYDTNEKLKYKGKVSDIKYMKALFTMAHEVGHVLQWRDEDNTITRFDEFFKATHNNPDVWLEHLHKMWYELDAWVNGLKYIPLEFREEYKQYAYHSYKTYMRALPDIYTGEMMLRNLLQQLNFNKYNEVGYSSRNRRNFT